MTSILPSDFLGSSCAFEEYQRMWQVYSDAGPWPPKMKKETVRGGTYPDGQVRNCLDGEWMPKAAFSCEQNECEFVGEKHVVECTNNHYPNYLEQRQRRSVAREINAKVNEAPIDRKKMTKAERQYHELVAMNDPDFNFPKQLLNQSGENVGEVYTFAAETVSSPLSIVFNVFVRARFVVLQNQSPLYEYFRPVGDFNDEGVRGYEVLCDRSAHQPPAPNAAWFDGDLMFKLFRTIYPQLILENVATYEMVMWDSIRRAFNTSNVYIETCRSGNKLDELKVFRDAFLRSACVEGDGDNMSLLLPPKAQRAFVAIDAQLVEEAAARAAEEVLRVAAEAELLEEVRLEAEEARAAEKVRKEQEKELEIRRKKQEDYRARYANNPHMLNRSSRRGTLFVDGQSAWDR